MSKGPKPWARLIAAPDLRKGRHYRDDRARHLYRCDSVRRGEGFATMTRLDDGEEFDLRIDFLCSGVLTIAPRGFDPDHPDGSPEPVPPTASALAEVKRLMGW